MRKVFDTGAKYIERAYEDVHVSFAEMKAIKLIENLPKRVSKRHGRYWCFSALPKQEMQRSNRWPMMCSP